MTVDSPEYSAGTVFCLKAGMFHPHTSWRTAAALSLYLAWSD